MHTIRNLRALVASAALLAAAGCATGPEAVEADFGNSVRAMRQAQIANPSAPVDNDPIDHGDGQRVNGAIEAYRKGVGDLARRRCAVRLGVGHGEPNRNGLELRGLFGWRWPVTRSAVPFRALPLRMRHLGATDTQAVTATMVRSAPPSNGASVAGRVTS